MSITSSPIILVQAFFGAVAAALVFLVGSSLCHVGGHVLVFFVVVILACIVVVEVVVVVLVVGRVVIACVV